MEDAPLVYGKYQLLELLARGGMAEVFKAKSHGVEGFEKILVIKRILNELSQNQEFVDMFINEAKIAVTLSHANIVQVFDLGRADDTYFIAMEYVAGLDLATVLRRGLRYDIPLPVDLGIYIVSEVAKALDYAHRRRDGQMNPLHIVHRDVSPQNILLSYEGEVKLADFGIAKARTSVTKQGTEAGIVKGKYAYMSPEQARGEDVDFRTDIYALGIVLYEVLAGKRPFDFESSYDTLKAVRDGRFDALSKVAPHLPAELQEVAGIALAPHPDSRFENAGRIYEELVQYLYSTKRRIGAHDLAEYLERLRTAVEGGRRTEPNVGLRKAFDVGQTQPSIAKQTDEPTTGAGHPQRTTGAALHATPQAMYRDVAFLSITTAAEEPLPEFFVREHVHSFGGVLCGQGQSGSSRWWVAVFGAKNPTGRDPETAARCALSLCSRATDTAPDQRTTVQVGVHMARVIVDAAQELLRDEKYERAVDVARGIAKSAAYGTVCSSDEATRALQRGFRFDREETPVSLIGERDPSDAYGRFVGRKDELRKVGEVLAVANKGRTRTLSIVGEPGSGKTRLILETARRLRKGGHDVALHIVELTPQDRDVPLSACLKMLRDILGIGVFEDEEIQREKIGRLRELGLKDHQIAAVETVFGLVTGGASNTAIIKGTTERIARKLAQDRLTLFVVDGCENIDPASLILLSDMLAQSNKGRAVGIFTHRSGPTVSEKFERMHNHVRVDLAGLKEDALARLTAERLEVDEVPMELLKQVLQKTGGNPLFVEEYLRSLQDAGALRINEENTLCFDAAVAADEVPKTLRGIVSGRIAALEAEDRAVLQIGSVIGLYFQADVVEMVTGLGKEDTLFRLGRLVESQALVERVPGEYAFLHSLLRDVVYEGLTIDVRREMHGAVGTALAELHPDHVGELAERLAHHHQEAGNRERAIKFLMRSVDRLEKERSFIAAVGALSRVIEMTLQAPQPDHDRVLHLHERIAELCFRGRDLDYGAERTLAAMELAEALGRPGQVARFSMMHGRFLTDANRFAEARPWLGRARQVARDLDDRDLLRDITVATAESNTRNGDYGSAIGLLREALDLSVSSGDERSQSRCLLPLALAYAGTGDRDAAMEALEDAKKVASDEPFARCELLKTDSLVNYYVGDMQRAITSAESAMELAKEYGFVYEAAINAHNIGDCHLRLGNYKKVFALLKYSYDLAREHGFVKLLYANMRVLGFVDAIKFGSIKGHSKLVEAHRFAEDEGYLWDLIQAKYLLAIVDHSHGREKEGRNGFRDVLRLSAEYGHRHYERAAEEALAALDAGLPVSLSSR